MKKIIYLLVGIILFGGLYYSCAPEELPGSIYGTVVDKATGEPIKSAGVELSPSGLKTVTGSEGQFEFTELDPGKYTLIITKTGYIDGVSGTIEVKPGQQAKGDVQIEKLPPALKVVNDNREEISTLDFGSAIDDVARSFSIFNDGTESLEWQITATADWIKSISKTEGVLSEGATQSLIVTIDRDKLNIGENKTTVHITSNSGSKQLIVTATNNYQPTTLNILPVTDIKSSYAVLHGEILTEGTPKYTERGFVYSESTKPTIENCIQQLTTPLTDETMFSIEVAGLMEGKTYYVRAYAINGGKAAYSSNEVSFTPKGTALPKVATKSITDIQRAEGKATILGEIQELGDPAYSERGFVYGTTNDLSIANGNKVEVKNDGNSEYSAVLSNLALGHVYYIRAYAINTVGVAYGEELSADFNPIKPAVTTNDVTAITDDGKATFNATITNVGDPVYSERGFVYGKSTNPLIGSAEQLPVVGIGDGAYYKNVEGLDANIPYYVRAYLIYSQGTIYGEEKTFSVQKTSAPTVVTTSVSNISYTSATTGGVVTSDGGENVTERGVVYSTTENPTIDNTKISNGVGVGTFSCELTELKEGVTYYVRAYAINARGVSYGEQVSFTTKTQMLATLTTTEVTEITETTAVTGGEVTSDGGATVTERGVVYSTSQNPTTSSSKIVNGSGVGSFICNLSNLKPNTTYYVRAYAKNSKGTAYGTQVAFTTLQIYPPTLTTTEATEVTETTAVVGGNVTDDGGANVTERGVVYSTSPNPTTSNSKVTSGSGLGAFVCNLTNLKSSTTYYARAYAKNTKGTSYGEQVTFTTLQIYPPTLITTEATQITETTAVTGGNVIDDGGADVIERGVVYSTSQNPTISNNKVTNGSGLGLFVCNLTDLKRNTTYYVRAYARNSQGVAYGEEISFMTEEGASTGIENGYSWINLGLSVKWATYNVGATNPEDYGDYFAWGETEPKEEYNWSTYKWCDGSKYTMTKYNNDSSYGTVDNKKELELEDDAAHVHWGGSWRMPTDVEWKELQAQCTWTWITQNGINGYKVTSKSNGNSIFLPAAGYRVDDLAGSHGNYWSSSLFIRCLAWNVYFISVDMGMDDRNRCEGLPVRPVCP